MNFKRHSIPEGYHAFLGGSNYHWLNYDEEKLISVYKKRLSAQRGTDLHSLAKECIRLGVRLPRTKETLNMYVNDAIGFKMEPEVVVWYSPLSCGTADALSWRRNVLRIHDLKTGEIPASMDQLMIYAAYFCLDNDIKPSDIEVELRIYQGNEIEVYAPQPEELLAVMDKAVVANEILKRLDVEV